MEREIFLPEIEARINSQPPGSVFVTSDFADIASSKTASRALQRLEAEGTLRRVLRGVYERPEYSEFLKENIAASPDKVARAIARNHGWRIVPSGDAALNMLGLSTQVPSVWLYVSDGPYRKYQYERVTLQFKRTAQKELTSMSDKSALVIQALKALGKERASDEVLHQIAFLLTDREKQAMLEEAQHTTAWIFQLLKRIAAQEVNE